MTSLNDAVLNTLNGAILYDRSILSQVSDEIFLISSWKNSSKISNQYQSGGRGETFIISNNGQEFVLRHYNRGGYLAKFNRDSYFWLGQEKTRPFLEWRLLKKLYDLGLPAPKPVVARYTRRGMFYHSDIITVRIPNIQPLSSMLMENDIKSDFWYSLGSTIYRFHRAGVFHADLNCHNIQIDQSGKIWSRATTAVSPSRLAVWSTIPRWRCWVVAEVDEAFHTLVASVTSDAAIEQLKGSG